MPSIQSVALFLGLVLLAGFAGRAQSARLVDATGTTPLEQWRALTVEAPQRSDPNAARVVENFLNVLGGPDHLRGLEDLAIHYRLARASSERVVREVYGPRERFLRVAVRRILDEDFSDVTGFDGQSAWALMLSEAEPSFRFVTGVERRLLRRARLHPNPLLEWRAHGLVLGFAGEVQVRGRDCYRVRVHYPDGLAEAFDFDQETFLLVRRGGWRVVGEVIVPAEWHFLKYTRVDGYWLPSAWSIHLSGEQSESATLLRAAVNEPVPPESFQAVATREGWLRTLRWLEQ